MGTFTVRLGIGSPHGQSFPEVEALVDTGATFTCIPKDLLRELGHQPVGSERFELGDGRVVERDLTEAPVRIDGKTRTSICVFADEESTALLGAVTLQQFLLAPDPVDRELVPVRGCL